MDNLNPRGTPTGYDPRCMKDYTIYRFDLEKLTANAWKVVHTTPDDLATMMKKWRGFVKRNDLPTVFIAREEQPQSELIIPVFKDMK